MSFDISIITPTFNVEQFIIDTLNSIKKQTFKGSVEILIIDDCSQDNTVQVVEQYQKENPELFIRILKQEKNNRQGAARNRGVLEANGKYIFFLDGDDFLHEEALEKMFAKAEEKQYDFVVCDWIYHFENRGLVYVNFDEFMTYNEYFGKDCERLLEAVTYFSVNKLYNRQFLLENNIRYGEGYIYEDFEFYMEVATKANKIAIVHNPYYIVRVNEFSTTKMNRKSLIHIESLEKAVTSTISKFHPRREESYFFLYKYLFRKSLNYLWDRAPKSYRRKTLKRILQLLNSKKTDYIIPNRGVTPLNKIYFKKKLVQKEKVNAILLIDALYNNKKVKKFGMKLLQMKRVYLSKKVLSNIKRRRKGKKKGKKILELQSLPIQDNLILFFGFDFQYKGNSKYFFDYLVENYSDKYQIYFATRDESVPEQYRVEQWSLEFYKLLSQAKVVVAESWLALGLRKKEDQIWLQLWHGTPFKKMLFDSHERQIMSRTLYHKRNKHRDIKRWDYLLADSEVGVEKFASAFTFDKNKILNYGYPRVQWLKQNEYNEALKMSIKKSLNIPLDKKIVLYVPTWRDYNHRTEDIDLTYILDITRLQKLLGDDYFIIDKGHAFSKDIKNDFDSVDTQQLLLIADIVVSDYSSIIFDCIPLNIPFYLFINDFEKYDEARGVYPEIYEDLLPLVVNTEEELYDKIKNEVNIYDTGILNKYMNENVIKANDCLEQSIWNFIQQKENE